MEEVQFWNFPEELKLKEELKMYPPRFQITVNGNPTSDKAVKITFHGAKQQLYFDYFLPESHIGMFLGRCLSSAICLCMCICM